jgi:alkylhydroperoxidase family enzyme
MDTNAAGSSTAGASENKIAAIERWRESDLFSQSEQSALAFAEGMTRTPADVPEDVFADARRHFSDPQLVELAATVAMENYRARFNRAFLVESQHFYHLHREQLPAPPTPEDIVTEASMESFPSSDAPGWIH